MRIPAIGVCVLLLGGVLLWPIFGPHHNYYNQSSHLIAYYFFAFTFVTIGASLLYASWIGIKTVVVASFWAAKLTQKKVSKIMSKRNEDKSKSVKSATNKVSALLSDYRFHCTLTSIEMNLSEMFRTLSAGGVDNRRDRMSSIALQLETARNGSSVLVNMDAGSHQETARHIIEADSKDLANFREKRRNARNMAFAFELLINQSPLASRNLILGKQVEALNEGKKLPYVIPALALILELELHPTSAEQLIDALKQTPDYSRVLRCLFTSRKLWGHPSKKLHFLDMHGWKALEAMRKV